MKPAFKISLLANALLAALAGYLAMRARPARFTAVPLSPVESAVATTPPQTQPGPFHWSRLESSDYRIYIANLRAFGCPAQTLRDIISADVDTLYARKRRELRLDDAAPATGPWSRSEETALVTTLLGDRPVSHPSVQEQQLASSNEQPAAKAAMPLVFQNVDLDALKLQDGQREGIEELRQMFLAELGGTNQDPNDPAYYERWKKAQAQVDSMLPGMIGGEAFMKMQSAADDSGAQSPQSP